MNFNMMLVYQDKDLKENGKYKGKIFDDLDPYYALFGEICQLIEDSGAVEFVVEGWLDIQKRVTCDWDLMCVLEQFPELIDAIQKDRLEFDLDFYEQGSEFTLFFQEQADSLVQVNLRSMMSRTATAHNAYIQKETLYKMLIRLYDDFLHISGKICPYLLEKDIMRDFVGLQNKLKKPD